MKHYCVQYTITTERSFASGLETIRTADLTDNQPLPTQATFVSWMEQLSKAHAGQTMRKLGIIGWSEWSGS
jgi:hypothetical protein